MKIILNISILLCSFSLIYCLTCLSCDQITQPRHCHYVETCSAGEMCGSQLQLSVAGYNTYTIGCVAKSSCSNGTGSAFCGECCNDRDLCNAALCGEPDYPATRGPVCYNCQSFTGNQPCRRIDFCSVHEDCSLLGVEEFGDLSLTSGCKPRYDCLATPSAPAFGRRSAERAGMANHARSASHVVCESCCSKDLCNLNCSGSGIAYCDPSTCIHGVCSSAGPGVPPGSPRGTLCACSPGWGGPRCDQGKTICFVSDHI